MEPLEELKEQNRELQALATAAKEMVNQEVKIARNDVIQMVPGNKWGGYLAIVDEVKNWGV